MQWYVDKNVYTTSIQHSLDLFNSKKAEHASSDTDKEFILMVEALNERFVQTSVQVSKNVYFYDMIVTEKINSLINFTSTQSEEALSLLPKLYTELQKQRKKVLAVKTRFVESGNNFGVERELFFSNSIEGSKAKYRKAKNEKNAQRNEYKNAYVR